MDETPETLLPKTQVSKTLILSDYAPLVKSIVRRYIGRGVEYDDLFQLGCLGLVKAHKKFDEKYGVKFTTYAVPLIAGEIKRFLRDDGQIKVSRNVKSLYIRIKRLLALHQNDSESPSIDFMAKELEVSREDIIYAMEAAHMPLNLFDNGDSDGLAIGDRLVGDDNSNLADSITLQNMLAQLEDREKKIILLRFFRNATQAHVARTLNISQVQVSRIEQRVLERFRESFRRDEDLA